MDEFNVSSTQFVGNLLQETPAGQEMVLEQILEFELLLIQQLNFHLVVHTPYRPMEGLLIDLKVGGPERALLIFILDSSSKSSSFFSRSDVVSRLNE